MRESGFKPYSFGIVAENKTIGDMEAHITPVEQLTLLDGELASNPVDKEISYKDSSGIDQTARTSFDNTVVASWLPLGSNRLTAPDIRRNERVMLWRYGDADKFYWTSLGLDDELRKLETAIYSWSATKDEGDSTISRENSYVLELSTHKKNIKLTTSKANGEPYAYTIELNTALGQLLIKDDVGNSIKLDSLKTLIELINKDRTHLKLDRQNIDGFANQKINLKANTECLVTVGATSLSLTPGVTTLITPSFDGKSG